MAEKVKIPSEEELTDGLMEAWEKAGRIHLAAEAIERVRAGTIASQLRTLLSPQVTICNLQSSGARIVLEEHAKRVSDPDSFMRVTKQAIQSLTGGQIKFVEFSDEKEDFNKTHPELRDGEMFFCNIARTVKCLSSDTLRERAALMQRYKTLRTGTQAYNKFGELLSELIPIFVQRTEIERLRETALFE